MLAEDILIAEYLFLCGAEISIDGISAHPADCRHRLRDHVVVLDIEASDLTQSTAGGLIVGDELCDDSELGVSIDDFARTVKRLVSLPIWVEITSIRVASAWRRLV